MRGLRARVLGQVTGDDYTAANEGLWHLFKRFVLGPPPLRVNYPDCANEVTPDCAQHIVQVTSSEHTQTKTYLGAREMYPVQAKWLI